MRLHDDIDFTTLNWVKQELDETLKQARQALEAYVEDTSDTSQMRFCATYLHQVQGTLRMVELHGAALVVDEMEQVSLALLDARVADTDEGYALLMRGIVQLPDYLERLQSGHRDIPVVLLPLLNDLRAVRDESPLLEAALFAPDLSAPLPDSASGPDQAVPDRALRVASAKIRKAFESALLHWFKDDAGPQVVTFLKDLCDRLCRITSEVELRRSWWIAAGVLDGVATGAIKPSKTLKVQFGKLDREIKEMALHGERYFGAHPPDELCKALLYYVAHADAGSDRIDELKEVFRLDQLVPKAEELEHAQGAMSGHNRELLSTVSGAIKEDLLRVKDALDLKVRQNDRSTEGFDDQCGTLERVADTLGMLGMGTPRKVVLEQMDHLKRLIEAGGEPSENSLLDIAGSLLYVESSLDDYIDMLGAPETESDAAAEAVPDLPPSEVRRILDALMKEASSNLQVIKQNIVEFIEAPWDHERVRETPRLLEEIVGALKMLDLDEAAMLLEGVIAYNEVELLHKRSVPDADELDTFADALASVEYYLEAVREHRPGRDKILEVARQSLSKLGYLGDQAAEARRRIEDEAEARADAEEALTEQADAEPAEEEAPDLAKTVEFEAIDLSPPDAEEKAAEPAREPGSADIADDIDEEIREVFIEEVEEELGNLRQLHATWKADPEDEETLTTIRRTFHTLKGSGRLVGALTIGEFSWEIENMLNRVLDGTIESGPPVVGLMDHALAALPELLANVKGEGRPSIDIEAIKRVAAQLASGEEAWLDAAAPPAEPAAEVEAEAAEAESGDEPEAVAEPADEADLAADLEEPESLETEEVDLGVLELEDLADERAADGEAEPKGLETEIEALDEFELADAPVPEAEEFEVESEASDSEGGEIGLEEGLEAELASIEEPETSEVEDGEVDLEESLEAELAAFQETETSEADGTEIDLTDALDTELPALEEPETEQPTVAEVDLDEGLEAELAALEEPETPEVVAGELEGDEGLEAELAGLGELEGAAELEDLAEPETFEVEGGEIDLEDEIDAELAALEEPEHTAAGEIDLEDELESELALLDEAGPEEVEAHDMDLEAELDAELAAIDAPEFDDARTEELDAEPGVPEQPTAAVEAMGPDTLELEVPDALTEASEPTEEEAESEVDESWAAFADGLAEEDGTAAQVPADEAVAAEEGAEEPTDEPADEVQAEDYEEVIAAAAIELESDEAAEALASGEPDYDLESFLDEISAGEVLTESGEPEAFPDLDALEEELIAEQPAEPAEFAPSAIDPVLLEILRTEVAGHIGVVANYLAGAEDDQPAVVTEHLLRAVHTLNGAIAMVELPALAAVTGPLEGYVKRLRLGELAPGEDGVAALDEAVRTVRAVVDGLDRPDAEDVDTSGLSQRLAALRDELPEPENLRSLFPVVDEGGAVAVSDSPEAPVLESEPDVGLGDDELADLDLDSDIEPFAPLAEGEDPLAALDVSDEARAEDPETPIEAGVPFAATDDVEVPEVPAEVDAVAEAVEDGAEEAEAVAEAADDELEEAEAGAEAAEESEAVDETAADEAEEAEAVVEAADEEPEEVEAAVEAADEEPERAEAPEEAEAAVEVAEEEPEEVEAVAEVAEEEPEEVEAVVEAADEEAEEVEAVAETADEEAEEAEAVAEAADQEPEEAEAAVEVAEEEAEEIEAVAEAAGEEPEEAETVAEAADEEREEPEAVAEAADEETEEPAAETATAADEAAGEAIAALASDLEAWEASAEEFSDLVVPEEDTVSLAELGEIDDDLLEIFLQEGAEILDESDHKMASWREAPDDHEAVVELQRELHTLKGGARMTGLAPIGDLSHAMESLFEGVVEDRVEVTRRTIEILEYGFDRLHQMLAKVRAREPISTGRGAIMQIEALLTGTIPEIPEVTDEKQPPPAEARPVEAPEPVETAPEALRPTTLDQADAKGAAPARPQQELIRVRADLLDNLVNYAGEVSIYRSRLEQQIGTFRFNLVEFDQTVTRLRDQLRKLEMETEAQILSRYQREAEEMEESFDPLELDRFSTLQQLSRALAESVSDLVSIQGMLDDLTRQSETLLLQQSRVNSDLQEGLMRTRMVPFDSLVPRLRRILRQTSQELGKKAGLRVEGAQGEMDRTVLERITAPLEHMLRNAIVHGLESPEERERADKPAEGTIRMSITREATEVVITVADDGAGIDHERVREKALDRGLLKADAELTDRDLYGFILETGFTTVDEVTKVAGRGVGMDVVNNEIKQLGGSLDISSRRGAGTTFVIRLPFTLAVTHAIMVRVGESTFAVPLSSIQGVVRMSRREFEERLDSGETTYEFTGEDYQLQELSVLLGLERRDHGDDEMVPVLMSQIGDQRAALRVDLVMGSREVVVKSVGPQISSVPGIFGATILGDGSVVMILDLGPLIRRGAALRLTAAELEPAEAGAEAEPEQAPERLPLIMVVDDSITMRKVTTRVLQRHDMDTVTAKDGVDALEQLQDRLPDLMLLDIEMPRMDGYELATHMRNDDRLKSVPIIMVTSRSGAKHRERALEIGVNRYLGKPYQEAELLSNVRELLDETVAAE